MYAFASPLKMCSTMQVSGTWHGLAIEWSWPCMHANSIAGWGCGMCTQSSQLYSWSMTWTHEHTQNIQTLGKIRCGISHLDRAKLLSKYEMPLSLLMWTEYRNCGTYTLAFINIESIPAYCILCRVQACIFCVWKLFYLIAWIQTAPPFTCSSWSRAAS